MVVRPKWLPIPVIVHYLSLYPSQQWCTIRGIGCNFGTHTLPSYFWLGCFLQTLRKMVLTLKLSQGLTLKGLHSKSNKISPFRWVIAYGSLYLFELMLLSLTFFGFNTWIFIQYYWMRQYTPMRLSRYNVKYQDRVSQTILHNDSLWTGQIKQHKSRAQHWDLSFSDSLLNISVWACEALHLSQMAP